MARRLGDQEQDILDIKEYLSGDAVSVKPSTGVSSDFHDLQKQFSELKTQYIRQAHLQNTASTDDYHKLT
eukprot:736206-Karenia_brevis.AAC.1